MTNHVHLAVEVGQVSLSRIMQNICSRYSRWINWQHKRIGHLFSGRFKAIMIDADSYLSQVVGYIHLNPVRARMVESCEEYEWSSHRYYIGTETIPWLTTETVLSQFSETSRTHDGFSMNLFAIIRMKGIDPNFMAWED